MKPKHFWGNEHSSLVLLFPYDQLGMWAIVGTETMQEDERANQIKAELAEVKRMLSNISNALLRHNIYKL